MSLYIQLYFQLLPTVMFFKSSMFWQKTKKGNKVIPPVPFFCLIRGYLAFFTKEGIQKMELQARPKLSRLFSQLNFHNLAAGGQRESF